MSDYIIEILEPVINIIEIETSIEDSVSDNISVEYQSYNSIEIVNTEKILASDMPYGYPINDTIGDLPYVRVSGLMNYVDESLTISMENHVIRYHMTPVGPVSIDGGSP